MKCTLLYLARTMALLGTILENNGNEKEIKPLKESLNPLSKNKLSISKKELPTFTNWNIV